jgi:hypothetical protein
MIKLQNFNKTIPYYKNELLNLKNFWKNKNNVHIILANMTTDGTDIKYNNFLFNFNYFLYENKSNIINYILFINLNKYHKS